MKAQFKYSFLTGLTLRGTVFGVITAMMLAFGVLGSLWYLPHAAHVTALSLGGVAIAAMLVVNIICDAAICRRALIAPDAYLYALTPAPRWKTLLAGLVSILTCNTVTMAAVVMGELWLSLNMNGANMWLAISGIFRGITLNGVWVLFLYALLYIFGYMLVLLIILFCIAAGKSIFFKKAASGLLAFLLSLGCFYAVSLLPLLLIPVAGVSRWPVREGIFIYVITVGNVGFPLYVLLIGLAAAGLFALTSKLLERKMNI